jgi:ferrous iron transport protein B
MKSPEIVLVGQPNSGKSTVFNVVSDIKTSVSNFSGTSVDIAHSCIGIRGQTFHIVDLPGVYSLNPGDEAEKVSFAYLTGEHIDLIVNVVDASMLSRSLELTVELMEFGIPMVIALNMWDEAERKGIKIYPKKLEKLLNIPVVTTSALYGKGIRELVEKCSDVVNGNNNRNNNRPVSMPYTSHIEESVRQIEDRFRDVEIQENGSPRFYAIKALENPEIVPEEMLTTVSGQLETMHDQIQRLHHKDAHETISYERHHLCMKLMEDTSHFVDRKTIPFREKLDRYFLHPLLGYFPLVLFFLIFFGVIYFIGNLLSAAIAVPLGKIPALYEGLKAGHPFLWFTIEGVFLGIEGAIGIVLPFFLPLIFLTAFFEDTGYLSRIAFLMDGFMHKIGLHGKSVAPFILGFGCTVPAMYGIRILENKRERDLTAILLPFIPCTARTSIILALTAAFTGPLGALFIYIFIIFVVGGTGRLMSLFMGKPTGLVMEIPDLKVPSLRVSAGKTWLKMKNFLKFAVPFLVVGSILMGWLEYAAVNDVINRFLSPLVQTVLGLDERLGSTLVYGFFRKELVVVMANSAFGIQEVAALPLTRAQVLVFIVFVTLYFPCFSTFIVMWKEFGKKVVLISSLLSVVVAVIAAFLVRLVLM